MVASDIDDALDSARGLVLRRAIDERVDDSDGVGFNTAIAVGGRLARWQFNPTIT